MKTNYIFLALLLSFSFASAQSNVVNLEAQINQTVSVSEVHDNDVITVEMNNTKEDVNETLLIDTDNVKEYIARSSSDIRLYLNRMRNVDNINLLFPQINKSKSV